MNIAINGIGMPNPNLTCQSCPPYNTHTMSSSVPAHALRGSNRATSAGPRLHDYSIPATAKASGGLTQLRPGLLGVSTRSGSDLCSVSQPFEAVSDPPGCTALKGSLPVPVPGSDVMSDWAQCHGHEHRPTSGMAGPQGYFMSSQNGHSLDHLIVPNSFSGGGWSLPRSSLRSGSMSSRSGSRSGSRNRSDDESECVNGNLDEINNAGDRQKRGFSSRGRSKEGANVWKREEDELNLEFSLSEEDEDIADEGSQRMTVEEAWDGMDMDMDMD